MSAGRQSRRIRLGFRLFALVAFALVMSLPFVWMISASFKPREEVVQLNLVPHHPTVKNYPIVLNMEPDPVQHKKLDLSFGRWYFNSFFIAFGVTFLQVLTSALAAYAFARLQWKGRDRLFLIYLATMMIPGVVLMIPNFQIMVDLHFLNTYHGLIVPAAFSAFGTFLLRQFMGSIPRALDEAATIDGAGHWRIFWDVIMPLSRAGIVALGVITFLGSFQSFFWPLIMLNDPQLFPMSVGMITLDSSYDQQTELIMAATVMNVVPLIVVFAIFQKFLVSGLQLGGVKG
jgi:ABC-type glycerol-3-phosphate transport system permease component